jgi:hypothetical protein
MYGLMIGARVRGVFDRVNDEVPFLRWRIADT